MDDFTLRNRLYRLIISQLTYDGYVKEADSLSVQLNLIPKCMPSTDLYNTWKDNISGEPQIHHRQKFIDLDVTCDELSQINAPEPSKYRNVYYVGHKLPCKTAAFNSAGNIIATGSSEGCVKIVDFERIKIRSSNMEKASSDTNPVIRALYDGVEQVNCIDFHPFEAMLAYGSNDRSIRFVDYSKISNRSISKHISEVLPVRKLKYHPGGEYMLVATDDCTLRLYDLKTCASFVSPNQTDQHKDICFSNTGKFYTTCSKDGSIKTWDGVSNRCVLTLSTPHNKLPVSSAVLSKNDKYILSSGYDGVIKLWDIRSNEIPVIKYVGSSAICPQEIITNAIFNHDESYVLYAEPTTGTLCSWNSRSAEKMDLISLGHTGFVNGIVHSSTSPAFVTFSDDNRGKCWLKEE